MSDHQDQFAIAETAPDTRRLRRLGLGAAVVAIVAAAVGIGLRVHSHVQAGDVSRGAAVPDVAVIVPQPAGQDVALVLPGQLQAYNSAAIFARTTGYVRKWDVDIGEPVRAGQVLAELDAPDLDQQLAQARADYKSALANQKLAGITARRWSTMLTQDAVSQQEADEKNGDMEAKVALSNAAMANVRRLEALESFLHLRAPFAGIVTSRGTQIGQLVVAGDANSQPLFTVSDIHRLRLYVRVPQGHTGQVQVGNRATLTVPEYPSRKFDALLTRTSHAVDVQSGAELVELQAANPDGALKPGGFAQVTFGVGGPAGDTVEIPGTAILYGSGGPGVMLVDAQGRVTLRKIAIARDEGTTVAVHGVTAHDRLVDSPPDYLHDGDRVRVAQDAKGAHHGD